MAGNKCVATVKSTGQRCQNWPIAGTTVCRFHGGAAPQVREAARRRLLEAADKAAAVLVEMVKDQNLPPAVRLGAVRDLLDRAGLVSKQQVEVEVRKFEQLIEAGDLIIDVEPEADNVIDMVQVKKEITG